jgi:hypothetical protein
VGQIIAGNLTGIDLLNAPIELSAVFLNKLAQVWDC